MVLPAEPRLVFFGDARTMARSPLRRWVVRRVGGILPIPSHGGPRSFATHLAAAGEVLHAGAVFCLFPESGMPAPVGTARPISPGIGYIALRSGASIVPVVIGGNDLLFLGRRIAVRIGEPVTWAELAASGRVETVPGRCARARFRRRSAGWLGASRRGSTPTPPPACCAPTRTSRHRRARGCAGPG